MRLIDLTGKRYGKLLVIKRVANRGKLVQWLCQCDCGNTVERPGDYLKSGDTQSCGCYKKQKEQANLREKYDNKRVDGVAMPLFKGQEPRKDSSTGFRGVSKYYTRKSKEERYRAWITVAGNRYYRSGFLTAEEAYKKGRIELEEKYLPKQNTENKTVKKPKYFPGQVIDGITLIEKLPPERDENGRIVYFWLAECGLCGNPFKVFSSSLSNRSRKTCGCIKYSKKKSVLEDPVGKTYGDFEVLSFDEKLDTFTCECTVCKNIKKYKTGTLRTKISSKRVNCREHRKKQSKKYTVVKKKLTIDNFMTVTEAAVVWGVSRAAVADRIKWNRKNGKINEWIEKGLIRQPLVPGSPWILSEDIMVLWYGPKPSEGVNNDEE